MPSNNNHSEVCVATSDQAILRFGVVRSDGEMRGFPQVHAQRHARHSAGEGGKALHVAKSRQGFDR